MKGPQTATIKDTVVNSQTEELDLPKAEVADEDIENIKHFFNIKSLLLGENEITDRGLEAICLNLTNLRKLFLNNNKISD